MAFAAHSSAAIFVYLVPVERLAFDLTAAAPNASPGRGDVDRWANAVLPGFATTGASFRIITATIAM
jgi:hypothetical protein